MVTAVKQSVQPIALYDKQWAFRKSKYFLTGLVTGRGGGKTFCGALDCFLGARNKDPIMAVAPTYGLIEDVTWPTAIEVGEKLGMILHKVKSPLPRITFRTRDGGRANIIFRSGEKPELLRGPSKAKLWLDEASIMHKDVFEIGLGVLRHEGRMGRMTMTFTPKGRRHWTYESFYKRKEDTETPQPDTFLVQAHSGENPFLPEEFVRLVGDRYTQQLRLQEIAGEFVDIEGLLFQREWFRFCDHPPARTYLRARYWDNAATADGGAFTAGVLVSRTFDGLITVEHVVRGQWSAGDRNRIIHETARQDAAKYSNDVMIYIEQEPGSGGKEAVDTLIKILARFPVYRDKVGGRREKKQHQMRLPGDAKIVRAQPFAAQAEAGNVQLVRASWNNEYLDELIAFPESEYSDQVDGTSGAYNKVAVKMDVIGTPARMPTPRVEPRERGIQLDRRERVRFNRARRG